MSTANIIKEIRLIFREVTGEPRSSSRVIGRMVSILDDDVLKHVLNSCQDILNRNPKRRKRRKKRNSKQRRITTKIMMEAIEINYPHSLDNVIESLNYFNDFNGERKDGDSRTSSSIKARLVIKPSKVSSIIDSYFEWKYQIPVSTSVLLASLLEHVCRRIFITSTGGV